MHASEGEVTVSRIDFDLTAAVFFSVADAFRNGAADCNFDSRSRGAYFAVTREVPDDHLTPLSKIV